MNVHIRKHPCYSSTPMRVWMNNAFIRSCQLLGTNPGPAPGRRGALSAVHGDCRGDTGGDGRWMNVDEKEW